MAILPTELPKWYQYKDDTTGWTPETEHINLPEVKNAWNTETISNSKPQSTLVLKNLAVISPVQIGGNSFPEGHTLPAQYGGRPCIPSSCLRGALLNWIIKRWDSFNTDEQTFWKRLLDAQSMQSSEEKQKWNWKPLTLRFETVWLKEITPFPLNPQQDWQLFDDLNSRKKLGVQWQVPTSFESESRTPQRISIAVSLKEQITEKEKRWFLKQLDEMLIEQGIGRGTASGFGRLGNGVPEGKWQITLHGMKPTIQARVRKKSQEGKYRWSPQVLRACLRGYFTRVALTLLNKNDALKLTDLIFGGTGNPARLLLTSYLFEGDTRTTLPLKDSSYSNIPKDIVESQWVIDVNCQDLFPYRNIIYTICCLKLLQNKDFCFWWCLINSLTLTQLVDYLLSLASHLGGLGPGWRRPPHPLTRFNGYRGSQFEVNSDSGGQKLKVLLPNLQNLITNLAKEYKISTIKPECPPKGSLISIWKGRSGQWDNEIVHGICRTDTEKNPNPDRPKWCGVGGNTQARPSGYSVRQHEDFCWITVFDRDVESVLRNHGFQEVWPNAS